MSNPIQEFEFTRWHSLHDPLSPLDPIQNDSPRFEAGKLPKQFVLLCWTGKELLGPVRFVTDYDAESYLHDHQDIVEYLPLPKPQSELKLIITNSR